MERPGDQRADTRVGSAPAAAKNTANRRLKDRSLRGSARRTVSIVLIAASSQVSAGQSADHRANPDRPSWAGPATTGGWVKRSWRSVRSANALPLVARTRYSLYIGRASRAARAPWSFARRYFADGAKGAQSLPPRVTWKHHEMQQMT